MKCMKLHGGDDDSLRRACSAIPSYTRKLVRWNWREATVLIIIS